MASIVVSGDTSGTITLQAPAVSGTTILTLPTTTGNIVSSTSVGTGTLTLTGFGLQPYLNADGTTTSTQNSILLTQNSTDLALTGAAQGQLNGIVATPGISNTGAGGTNFAFQIGAVLVPRVTSTGTAGRISNTGLFTQASRGYSADTSTFASNTLTGVTSIHGHTATLPTTAVTGTSAAYNATAFNLSGTVTSLYNYVGAQIALNPTTGVAGASTNVAHVFLNGAAIGNSTGTYAVANYWGIRVAGPTIGTNGTVTSHFGLDLLAPTVTGTLTNNWGIYQRDATATNYFNGKIGIGLTTPEAALQVSGNTVIGTTGAAGTVLRIGPDGANGMVLRSERSDTSGSRYMSFGTDYNERMRIASTGNVGIGTTGPLAQLSIGFAGSATSTPRALLAYSGDTLGGNANDMVYVSEFAGNTGNQLRLLFALRRTAAGASWETSAWRIQPGVDTSFTGPSGNRGYLEFGFGNLGAYTGVGISGNGGANPDVVVNTSGNVGIGTTSPSSISGGKFLTVSGAGTFATISVQAIEGVNNRDATLELLASGNGTSFSRVIYGDTDTTPLTPSPLLFMGYHSGVLTERMRITSTGLVGIGTTAPSQPLTVANGALFAQGNSDWFGVRGNSQTIPPSDNGSNAVLAINSNYSGGGGEVNFWYTNQSLAGGFRFMSKTGASTFNDVMYMQGNTGNIGIGTISPASFSSTTARVVSVNTSAGANTVAMALVNNNGAANTAVSLDFVPNTNIALAQIQALRTETGFGGATDLRFLNYNSSALAERMRISSDGNVRIGTTAANGVMSNGANLITGGAATAKGTFIPPSNGTWNAIATISVAGLYILHAYIGGYNAGPADWSNAFVISYTGAGPSYLWNLSGTNVGNINARITNLTQVEVFAAAGAGITYSWAMFRVS